jgi:uncharacterized coiled-coil protein SlyX
MQKTLQAQLESTMQALEIKSTMQALEIKSTMQALLIRIEHWTQQIISSMGQTMNQSIENMNAQSTHSNERINDVLQSCQNQADRFTAQMNHMVLSRDDAQSNSPNHTPV